MIGIQKPILYEKLFFSSYKDQKLNEKKILRKELSSKSQMN